MGSWDCVLESPYMMIGGRHEIHCESSIVLVASSRRPQRIQLG